MSGALNSVVGGGGGLLSSIGGAIGGAFGGPLGAAIGQALGGMFQQALGNGINSAIDTLVKEHGMPKFLGEEVKSKIAKVVAPLVQNSLQGVPQEARDIAQAQFAQSAASFQNSIRDFVIQSVLDQLRGNETGGSGKGAKATGGGWLQAIASVMGSALGEKAKELVNLSDQIKSVAVAKNNESLTKEQRGEQADKFNVLMTQFQATSQEYSYLNSVFSTAIKGIGEAVSSMARKQ